MITKGIGTEYRRKLAIVSTTAKGFITPAIAMATLVILRQEAGRILSRWCHRGWIKRIKRGVYIPLTNEDAKK